jgi:hypothetical protein
VTTVELAECALVTVQTDGLDQLGVSIARHSIPMAPAVPGVRMVGLLQRLSRPRVSKGCSGPAEGRPYAMVAGMGVTA